METIFLPITTDHIFSIFRLIMLSIKNGQQGLPFFPNGRPTTYATGKFVVDGNQHFTYSDRNAFRLAPTHRLDLSFIYTPTKKRRKKME